MSMPLTDLPLLALETILAYIRSPADLYRLCLVSHDTYHLTAPLLYRKLDFEISEVGGVTRFPKLLICLNFPGFDQRWAKWARKFKVRGVLGMQLRAEYEVLCGALAAVLGKIEGGRLVRFMWTLETSYEPPQVLIDALLKHDTLRSLVLGPDEGPSYDCALITAMPPTHCTRIRKLSLRGITIPNDEELALLRNNISAMGHLTQFSIFNVTVTGKDTVCIIDPSPLKGGISRLVSVGLDGCDLVRHEGLLGSFFNVSTLRHLQLHDCEYAPELLDLLSRQQGIINFEGLDLQGQRMANAERSLVNFIRACRNMKVLVLEIGVVSDEVVTRIMKAIVENGGGLKFLSAAFGGGPGRSSYAKAEEVSLERLRNIREMTVSLELDPFVDLPNLGSTLPKSTRVFDLSFPHGWLDSNLHGKMLISIQKFVSIFMETHHGQGKLELVTVRIGVYYSGVCFFYEPTWSEGNRKGVLVVKEVDSARAREIRD